MRRKRVVKTSWKVLSPGTNAPLCKGVKDSVVAFEHYVVLSSRAPQPLAVCSHLKSQGLPSFPVMVVFLPSLRVCSKMETAAREALWTSPGEVCKAPSALFLERRGCD